METRVAEYITEHRLLAPQQEVVVALSGGADSVALLLVLHHLGFKVQAAHCNFHLRGAESDRDQHFVEALCNRLNITLNTTHFDTQAEARATGESIEMAARTLRYKWFATLRRTIAIAHHRDDNNETLMLNLIRGTGLRGLTGIQPRANIMGAEVVRPLLCVSRNDITTYLARQNQDFVTDSTNMECDARRNVVRLRLMPLMAELNPSIGDTLQADIARFCEAQRLCDAAITHYAEQAVIAAPTNTSHAFSLSAIDASPAPHTVLHHLLTPLGFTAATIATIYAERNGQNGALYHSAQGRLLRHNGTILFRPNTHQADDGAQELPPCGTVTLDTKKELTISQLPYPCTIAREAHTAMLDTDRLRLPLRVRHTRQGDRFRPFGMCGSVLVSDYLTNLHFNVFDKEDQLVVTTDDDIIVWLVGLRIAAQAVITPTTQHVTKLQLRA